MANISITGATLTSKVMPDSGNYGFSLNVLPDSPLYRSVAPLETSYLYRPAAADAGINKNAASGFALPGLKSLEWEAQQAYLRPQWGSFLLDAGGLSEGGPATKFYDGYSEVPGTEFIQNYQKSLSSVRDNGMKERYGNAGMFFNQRDTVSS